MVLHPSQENLPSITDLAGYLQASPRGTVVRHPDKPDHFLVRGTETVYLVDAGSYERRRLPNCECLAWEYNRHCFHMKAVAQYLWEWSRCPICKGVGVWVPNGSVHYVEPRTGAPAMNGIPLICCMGAGTREGWEREGCFVPAEAA